MYYIETIFTHVLHNVNTHNQVINTHFCYNDTGMYIIVLLSSVLHYQNFSVQQKINVNVWTRESRKGDCRRDYGNNDARGNADVIEFRLSGFKNPILLIPQSMPWNWEFSLIYTIIDIMVFIRFIVHMYK